MHAKGQLCHSKCKLPVKRVYVPLHPTYTLKAVRSHSFIRSFVHSFVVVFTSVLDVSQTKRIAINQLPRDAFER
ncbi:MAG: hypothetical protein ACTS6G_00540 [Candidatus Hodgkinia cicadicola]